MTQNAKGLRGLQGKVAIVTGASSGIGRATALAFAREGMQVVVSDVAVSGGEETVRLIRENGGEAIFVPCDVSKSEDVQALVRQAVAQYGRLDFACNNAGIGGESAPTADYSEAGWNKVIGINPVSYTHLRAHETVLDLVCRLLLEKKKNTQPLPSHYSQHSHTNNPTNL